MEKLDLIKDFLEVEEHLRVEGRYEFFTHEQYYLEDIPDSCYYKVLRAPSAQYRGIVGIIFRDKKVTEIFSINKVNVPTYVSRLQDSSQTFEATLQIALQDQGQSVVLYGPSKLGKSALWKSILSEEAILVQCNHIQSLSDIYKEIIDLIKKPHLSQIIESGEETTKESAGANLNLGSKEIANLEIETKVEKSITSKQDKIHTYVEKTFNAQYISMLLKTDMRPIIFENYHRLKKETLKDLCIDLRTFSDENITTIFVGIPLDPFEITKFNSELLGRVIFMSFHYWQESELKKIAIGGASVLNIWFNDKTLIFLSKKSVDSPLLMQLFCLVACLASRVTYVQQSKTEVIISPEQFKIAMGKFGIMYLAPCSSIWTQFEKLCTLKDLPDDFITTLIDFIKSDKFSLNFNIKEIYPDLNIKTLIKLITKLNKNDSTVDFLVYNQEPQSITFGIPLAIVYQRWLT